MTYPSFTAGEVLRAADMNAVGLWLVKTVTVGTGVSSVPVADCFSADYTNYKIVIAGGVASTGTNMTIQLTGITGSVYNNAGTFLNYGSTIVSGFGPGLSTSFIYGPGDATFYAASIDIMNPFATTRKGIISNGVSGTSQYAFAGYVNSTTSSTGFTITPAAVGSTLTGGTIRVYGYRN
jgi:hypothetical protein